MLETNGCPKADLVEIFACRTNEDKTQLTCLAKLTASKAEALVASSGKHGLLIKDPSNFASGVKWIKRDADEDSLKATAKDTTRKMYHD